jgi:hypothetical protein
MIFIMILLSSISIAANPNALPANFTGFTTGQVNRSSPVQLARLVCGQEYVQSHDQSEAIEGFPVKFSLDYP